MGQAQPSDGFFNQYANACACASLLEITMRIRADNTPRLKHLAHAKVLQNVEAAIVGEFGGTLKPGEEELLGRSRVLRNKVMHGDFSTAKEKLVELGHALPGGAVTGVQLPEGQLTTETFTAALDGPR